jgi:Fe2+ transport system protein FeoA
VVDIVALSAIFYRLSEYGITPNRVAVLGSNLLILGNLILITIDLFRVAFRNASLERVNVTTAKYLPVYMVWTIVVVFVFPLVF